jgi:glutathione S-transferase
MQQTVSVAGFSSCPFHRRAVNTAKQLAAAGLVKFDDRTFATRDEYRHWLFSEDGRSSFSEVAAHTHTSSPFVWRSDSRLKSFVGGCDAMLDLAKALQSPSVRLPGASVYYTLPGAPNPRVVDMFAAEKGVDLISISKILNLGANANRTPEALKMNPSGGVPWLTFEDGTTISETIAICEFIDENTPSPSLIGATSLERAETRMWQRRVEQQIILPLFDSYRWGPKMWDFFKTKGMHSSGIPEASAQRLQTAKEQLCWLEEQMGSRPFVCGERYTIVDVQLFTILAWFTTIDPTILDDLSWVRAWFERTAKRPASVASDPKQNHRMSQRPKPRL